MRKSLVDKSEPLEADAQSAGVVKPRDGPLLNSSRVRILAAQTSAFLALEGADPIQTLSYLGSPLWCRPLMHDAPPSRTSTADEQIRG